MLQDLKDTLLELFHNWGISTLYHQDPELQLIPVKNPQPEQQSGHR